MTIRFKNERDFVQFIIKRADHSPDVIIGLGPQCFSFFSSGSWISGYFYNCKTHKFYDYFTIYKDPSKKHGFLGGIKTCEFIIERIRKVTNEFYK